MTFTFSIKKEPPFRKVPFFITYICSILRKTLQRGNSSLGIFCSKDKGTGDENVGPGIGKLLTRVEVDASVDLYQGVTVGLLNELTQLTNLVERVGDELLSPETGIDGHEQHHIDLRDDVGQSGDRRGGAERDGGMETSLANLLKDTVVMGERLEMDIHVIGSQVGDLPDELLRLDNHEMDVEGLLTQAGDMAQDRKTKGDVGDEDTVHDIEMEIVGTALIEPLHLAFEIAKIGSQQRGCY